MIAAQLGLWGDHELVVYDGKGTVRVPAHITSGIGDVSGLSKEEIERIREDANREHNERTGGTPQ